MRHAWILVILIAGLTAIACSGGEHTAARQVAGAPTAPPISAGQPKTIQFDQALSEEVSQLRTEVASLQDEEATAKSEVKEPPPTQQPTEPTATGQPDTKASDQTQMGICYRTPELQKKILEMLNVRLCQVVSAGELFRIRKLESVNTPSVKEGDFQGFANVQSMTLRTGKIEANGLRGLDGLKEIHLVIQRGQELSTESFMGIESVEELRIELSRTEAGGRLPHPRTAGAAEPQASNRPMDERGGERSQPVQESEKPRDPEPENRIRRGRRRETNGAIPDTGGPAQGKREPQGSQDRNGG